MKVNNTEKIEPLLAQMEQWSILSNILNYMQYDRHPKNYHSLGINAVNKYGKNLGIKEERDLIELDFCPTPDILKEKYLDVYEGIQSEILNTTKKQTKFLKHRTNILLKDKLSPDFCHGFFWSEENVDLNYFQTLDGVCVLVCR